MVVHIFGHFSGWQNWRLGLLPIFVALDYRGMLSVVPDLPLD